MISVFTIFSYIRFFTGFDIPLGPSGLESINRSISKGFMVLYLKVSCAAR